MSAKRIGWLAAAAFALAGCGGPEEVTYQGWVEADTVFVSPDEAGRVETLAVREGDTIAAGAPLFTVDDDLQQADLRQNQATVTNARQGYERAQVLLKTNVGTQKAFEDAEAALRTAEARLNSSQTRLARRRVASPVTGSVQQIYFRPGEMVPAGRPVVALLPPANVKLRFFVPEGVLPKVALDETVRVACDGCAADLTARVSFIARTAEFTPPVIYSLEERAKLVFLVEARPQRPEAFRVGQPVSIALPAPEAKR
jgi:HlyD family secretion protein